MCVRIGVIDGDGVKINYTAIPSLHDLRRAALSLFTLLRRFPLVGFCLQRERGRERELD